MYAEAVPDTSVADFAHWIVRHTRNRGGDADDIYAVLALLKRRCPLDLTQNSIYYLSNEESVQAIIKDMRVSSGIRRLCEEAKNTSIDSIDEAQEFSGSVLDAINSLRIANAYIPDFYDTLKDNCEEVKPLLAKASEQRRKEANERLKEYGYQEGMTYSQFREVLINRGWQPVSKSSSPFPDYREVLCGSLRCTGSFISNENTLSVWVEFIRNDESREVEKVIPTNLSVSTKNR
jgi:hypothetical protein